MNEDTRQVQVVVAYDFSPSAELALVRAIEIAARAPQHVLHIISVLTRHGSGPLRASEPDDADRIRTTLSDQLTSLLSGGRRTRAIEFFVHTRIGKRAEQILGLASDVGADLIFIGAHSDDDTTVARMFIGSVSERVVRDARCPVVVVRDKTYEDVQLAKMTSNEHGRTPYTPPHRYSYSSEQRASFDPLSPNR